MREQYACESVCMWLSESEIVGSRESQRPTKAKVRFDAFVCLFAASDLIQPGPRFPSAPLPMSDGEWFSYAMNAADDQLVERMRSLGREHASLWAEEQQEQVLQPDLERPPPPPREGIAQA